MGYIYQEEFSDLFCCCMSPGEKQSRSNCNNEVTISEAHQRTSQQWTNCRSDLSNNEANGNCTNTITTTSTAHLLSFPQPGRNKNSDSGVKTMTPDESDISDYSDPAIDNIRWRRVEILSIQVHRIPVCVASAGQSCSFAIKFLNTHHDAIKSRGINISDQLTLVPDSSSFTSFSSSSSDRSSMSPSISCTPSCSFFNAMHNALRVGMVLAGNLAVSLKKIISQV